MANETKTAEANKIDNVLLGWPIWLVLGTLLGTALGAIIGGILVIACGETESKTFDGPDGPYTHDVYTDETAATYFHPGMWGGALGGFVFTCLLLATLRGSQSPAVTELKSSISNGVKKVCKFFGGGSVDSNISTNHSINNGLGKK